MALQARSQYQTGQAEGAPLNLPSQALAEVLTPEPVTGLGPGAFKRDEAKELLPRREERTQAVRIPGELNRPERMNKAGSFIGYYYAIGSKDPEKVLRSYYELKEETGASGNPFVELLGQERAREFAARDTNSARPQQARAYTGKVAQKNSLYNFSQYTKGPTGKFTGRR